MTKLVLLHKADSIYDDEPDVRYDFPLSYLKAVTEGVGDWAIYYEPVKAGPRGYFAVARVSDVIPKVGHSGRFIARMNPAPIWNSTRLFPACLMGVPSNPA